MHSFFSFMLTVAVMSNVAAGNVGQRPLFGATVPEPEEDPKGILFKQITTELNAGQFCPESPSVFALWSKGRALTFIDGALYARTNTQPAEFVFTRSERDKKTVTISHIDPFGRQFWFQDNYGRQYINRDSNNVEFAVRLRKDASKGFLSIARNDRCLIFNDQGEGYMNTNTACEPLEFKAVPAWNVTWNDPLTWKNCVEDHIKQGKDSKEAAAAAAAAAPLSSSEAAENLRWAVCRVKCSEDHSQSDCKRCESVGYY